MKVGYARTSTLKQEAGLEAQDRDLKAVGVEKIFTEQVSSVDAKRPQLATCLDFVREGDVLVITKIDRLARSVADLLRIVEQLQARGVALQILSLSIDTGTATGKLVLTMLGGIADFERSIMLERQREGIAKAQREGKYANTGRKNVTRNERADQVKALHTEGVGPAEIARKLGMGRTSVYRALGLVEWAPTKHKGKAAENVRG